MYHLGIVELNSDLSLLKSPHEGVKWLKRSGECEGNTEMRPLMYRDYLRQG